MYECLVLLRKSRVIKTCLGLALLDVGFLCLDAIFYSSSVSNMYEAHNIIPTTLSISVADWLFVYISVCVCVYIDIYNMLLWLVGWLVVAYSWLVVVVVVVSCIIYWPERGEFTVALWTHLVHWRAVTASVRSLSYSRCSWNRY